MTKCKPTVLDLYSGAGGLSLGFRNAGFQIVGAVETDRWAADTYETNIGVSVTRKAVASLSDADMSSWAGVDVISGGPPCQGFSIAAKGRAAPMDERNEEVFHFLNVVLRLRPRVVLIENVGQFQKYRTARGTYLTEEVTSILHGAGYASSAHLFNATSFGVPQNRVRFFLLAFRRVSAPDLLRFKIGPDSLDLFTRVQQYMTVQDALSDLPPVAPRSVHEDAVLQYLGPAQNKYQELLRSPIGEFYNHVPMRHTPRLIERFAKIQIGANGTSVWTAHAPRKRGDADAEGARFEQNHRRMNPHAPAPTITAYMYSSCLHPYQNRNITVREAARLQSFPDMFRFTGKRTTLSNKLLARKGLHDDIGLDQLNQVGNAVPPLLAKGLADEIMKVISSG